MFEPFQKGKYFGLKNTTRLGRDVFFTGKAADFSVKSFEQELPFFKSDFGTDNLLVLNQVHDSCIITPDDASFDLNLEHVNAQGSRSADGFELAAKVEGKNNLCFGIRTADCLPILVETDSRIFLLHAGWRGLAKGILEEALKRISVESVQSFIIGPSAGERSYEVGSEVIAEFGNIQPVYEPVEDKTHKYLLDLKATAVKVFEQNCVKKSSDCLVEVSQMCTITSLEWHSHRREGSARGSNLMFVRMPF